MPTNDLLLGWGHRQYQVVLQNRQGKDNDLITHVDAVATHSQIKSLSNQKTGDYGLIR